MTEEALHDSQGPTHCRHAVTVTFDDEEVELGVIVSALNDAGYVVEGEKKMD